MTTPALVPSTPIEESASCWSRVPDDESALGEGRISSVIVGGPGLVAVGSTVAGDEYGDAAVWGD